MERTDIERAVEALQARGIPLADITSVMVREITGYGSYTSIIEHLRVIRGDVPADDAPVALVAEAEQRLQAARQRVCDLEAEIPEHEHRIEQARHAVIKAVNLKLIAKEADYRSYLPSDDPLLQTIDAQVEAAAQRLRQARAAREHLAQAIGQARQAVVGCEQRITEARRQVYLAQYHGDLLAQLEALRAEDPRAHVDSMAPDYFSRQARWHAQVRQVEAEIATVLAASDV